MLPVQSAQLFYDGIPADKVYVVGCCWGRAVSEPFQRKPGVTIVLLSFCRLITRFGPCREKERLRTLELDHPDSRYTCVSGLFRCSDPGSSFFSSFGCNGRVPELYILDTRQHELACSCSNRARASCAIPLFTVSVGSRLQDVLRRLQFRPTDKKGPCELGTTSMLGPFRFRQGHDSVPHLVCRTI